MASTVSTTGQFAQDSLLWEKNRTAWRQFFELTPTFSNMECISVNDPLYDLLVKQTSEARKKAPVQAGFNDYFPEAIMAVAMMSYMANQKHNPTEELGWSWNRSDDHADCVARHALRDDTLDEFNLPHKVAKAWRAMADLQKYLVEEYDLDLPPAAYLVPDDLSEKAIEKVWLDMTKKVDDKGLTYYSPAVDQAIVDGFNFWLGEGEFRDPDEDYTLAP